MLLIFQQYIENVENDLSHVVLEFLISRFVDFWGFWLASTTSVGFLLLLLLRGLLKVILGVIFTTTTTFGVFVHYLDLNY